MDAQKYVDALHKKGDVIRLACFDSKGWCTGRGKAIVIDRRRSIAIMLEGCGQVAITSVRQGAIVSFSQTEGREPRITGEPAYC